MEIKSEHGALEIVTTLFIFIGRFACDSVNISMHDLLMDLMYI